MSLPVDMIGGDRVRSSPAPLQPQTPPTRNPDPVRTAERVLETGSRWGRDDYAARMDVFAEELGKGDPLYRAQLIKEILKRDPNATNSWLTPQNANEMQAQRRISADEKALVVDTFAAAYNRGYIPENTIHVGINPKTGGDGAVKFNEVDQVLSGYYSSSGLGGGPDRVDNAKRAREFLDFINSSHSPEVAEFRQKYSEHLISEYVLNPAVGANNPLQRDAAAGLAANLLGGETNRPDIAADTLAKYSFDDFKSIVEAASRSNGVYGEESLRGAARDRNINARDISVPNGSALLINAVGRAPSASAGQSATNADKVVTELARLPANSPSVFDKRYAGGRDNVDNLTLAVNSHSKAVLDSLTKYDDTFIGTEKNPNLQQYMQNASELGALFKTTLFNQDSIHRNFLQDSVVKYAGSLKDQVNQPGPNADAAGRLAMLSASLTDGVRQGYVNLAADQKAKQELLGMVLDIALAGLPASKWAAKPVEDLIKSTFPDRAKLQEALNGLSGKLIDAPVGKLTTEAKKQITDALGADAGNLAITKQAVNDLNKSFFNQVRNDDYDKGMMQTTYNQILTGIAVSRTK